MFNCLSKSMSYIILCCYIMCANANFEATDEKSVLVGDWSLESSSGSYTMETSYYPNGIAKFVIFSKTASNQVVGYAIANWHLDDGCVLHTLFLDQSSADLKLVTGIEELERAVIVNSNHVRLFSTQTDEVKDLHRIKNTAGAESELSIN